MNEAQRTKVLKDQARLLLGRVGEYLDVYNLDIESGQPQTFDSDRTADVPPVYLSAGGHANELMVHFLAIRWDNAEGNILAKDIVREFRVAAECVASVRGGEKPAAAKKRGKEDAILFAAMILREALKA